MSNDKVEIENLDEENFLENNLDSKVESNIKVDSLREKSFVFAVRIIKLCKYLEKNSEAAKSVITQLLRAGTSIGANLEEAVAGQSKADFIHKNAISLKEARESNYWLRLILETEKFEETIRMGIVKLKDESLSIAKIIGSIIVKAKRQN